jgi:hypothetical protein
MGDLNFLPLPLPLNVVDSNIIIITDSHHLLDPYLHHYRLHLHRHLLNHPFFQQHNEQT